MVRISLSRADYTNLHLADIDERIGQHHGRAFLEKTASGSQAQPGSAADDETAFALQARFRHARYPCLAYSGATRLAASTCTD